MPRRTRFCPGDIPVHVIQRGNNRQTLFTSDKDIAAYARTGTLFEGRYRSSLVQNSEYFLTCLRYIELNPIRAGMVNDPVDYQWSSYRVHGFGLRTKMWTPHVNYLALGHQVKARQSAYRSLMNEALDADVITKIRHCVNTGLVLGTEAFRNQVASMHN